MDGAKILLAVATRRAFSLYSRILLKADHDVDAAFDEPSVVQRLREKTYDLLVLDMDLETTDPLALLTTVKRICPSTLVVATSQQPEARAVIQSFRAGAYDYLPSPIMPSRLREIAARAAEIRVAGAQRRRMSEELASERGRVIDLKKRLGGDDPFTRIIGTSPIMRNLVENLREVARTDSTVLLTGESGTGKGMVARTVHEASDRSESPFVEANCVVYSEGVLHSELFGHEKGSFTGATNRKRGRFELASGGTIFLDEIGDIQPSTQLLLLRILQERTFERVGGEETMQADARLIAATNRNLQEAMQRGEFRSDLYFRLNVIPVHLPPLREHREDVPELASHFVDQVAARVKREVDGFTDEVLEAMIRYDWPGNIRELENTVERMVVLAHNRQLGLADLPDTVSSTAASRPTVAVEGTLEDLEATRIRVVLEECEGNKKLAALRLGIHRSTLYAKLKKYALEGAECRNSDQEPSETATSTEKAYNSKALAG
jgi:DNA-binding NtrC family response regulator